MLASNDKLFMLNVTFNWWDSGNDIPGRRVDLQ